MEPRREEAAKTQQRIPEQAQAKTRFRIVKLEERIAPNKGGVPAVTKDRNCYGQHH